MRVPFVPEIVRHPFEEDPKRDPNLENYPFKRQRTRGVWNELRSCLESKGWFGSMKTAWGGMETYPKLQGLRFQGLGFKV